MNLDQTRLDTAVAAVAARGGCDDVYAARKPHIGVVIASPFDVNAARTAIGPRDDQGFRGNAQRTPSDILSTSVVAGRISVATLDAAHKIALFHAGARAVRAVPSMQAEPGVDRDPPSRSIERQTP